MILLSERSFAEHKDPGSTSAHFKCFSLFGHKVVLVINQSNCQFKIVRCKKEIILKQILAVLLGATHGLTEHNVGQKEVMRDEKICKCSWFNF